MYKTLPNYIRHNYKYYTNNYTNKIIEREIGALEIVLKNLRFLYIY